MVQKMQKAEAQGTEGVGLGKKVQKVEEHSVKMLALWRGVTGKCRTSREINDCFHWSPPWLHGGKGQPMQSWQVHVQVLVCVL